MHASMQSLKTQDTGNGDPPPKRQQVPVEKDPTDVPAQPAQPAQPK